DSEGKPLAEGHTVADRLGRSGEKEFSISISLPTPESAAWFSTRRDRDRSCSAYRPLLGPTKRHPLSATTARYGGTTTAVPDPSSSAPTRAVGAHSLIRPVEVRGIFEAIRVIRGS